MDIGVSKDVILLVFDYLSLVDCLRFSTCNKYLRQLLFYCSIWKRHEFHFEKLQSQYQILFVKFVNENNLISKMKRVFYPREEFLIAQQKIIPMKIMDFISIWRSPKDHFSTWKNVQILAKEIYLENPNPSDFQNSFQSLFPETKKGSIKYLVYHDYINGGGTSTYFSKFVIPDPVFGCFGVPFTKIKKSSGLNDPGVFLDPIIYTLGVQTKDKQLLLLYEYLAKDSERKVHTYLNLKSYQDVINAGFVLDDEVLPK